MKTKLYLLISLLLLTGIGSAQVAINSTGNDPDGSSMLDVSASDKGVLIPRLTHAQREAISLPAAGLLIYQTDSVPLPGFYFNAGTPGDPIWTKLSHGAVSQIMSEDSLNKVDVGTGNIEFYTMGAEQMRIDGTGQIEMYGPLKITSGTPANGKVLTSDSFGNATWKTPTGGGGLQSEITDADNDTRIQTEMTPDEDAIHFEAGGSHAMSMYHDGIDGLVSLSYDWDFSLSQNMIMSSSTSASEGVIFKGGSRFLHDYRSVGTDGANTFLGYNAGNFSMSGSSSEASYNTGAGAGTLYSLTTGAYNTASGAYALNKVNSGDNNAALGTASLYKTNSGGTNTAVGSYSGYNNQSGSGNVFLGHKAGYNETGSNKLYIDNSDTGTPLIYGEFDNDKLTVNGQLKITGGTPGDGKVLTSDASGLASWQAFGGGDNLGNHTMTQNLVTGPNYISYDGSNEGIYLNNGMKFIDFRDYNFRIIKTFGSNDAFPGINIYSGHETDAQPGICNLIGFQHVWPTGLVKELASISGYLENEDYNDYVGGLLFRTRNNDDGNQEVLFLSGYGKVGVLTTDPTAELEVNGQIKMTGGNPGLGKVLTCDDTGLATWEPISIGSMWIDDLEDAATDATSVFLGDGTGVVDNGDNNNTALGIESMNSTTSGYYNTAVGYQTLYENQTGAGNTAIGYLALNKSNLGEINTAIGSWALEKNTDGDYNTALGSAALRDNTEGHSNVALGQYALENNIKGNYSIAIGREALFTQTADPTDVDQDLCNIGIGFRALYSTNPINELYGRYNVALGHQALRANTIGDKNTAIGHEALYSNKTFYGSTAIGYQAMYYANNSESGNFSGNTALGYASLMGSDDASANTGKNNTALGSLTMTDNTSGTSNVAVGAEALSYNTEGSSNVAVGKGALGDNKAKDCNTAVGCLAMRYYDASETNEDSYNTAVGCKALYGNIYSGSTGKWNTAVGGKALNSNSSGHSNVASGFEALLNNEEGYENSAVGYQALAENTDGNKNTALGYQALNTNEESSGNTAIGYKAMYNAVPGSGETDSDNTAVGNEALLGSDTPENNTGVENTALGSKSLWQNTSGSYNTAIGYKACNYNTDGEYNTAVGYWALLNNFSGDKNTAVGYWAGTASIGTFNNTTALGYQALVNSSDKVVIGNDDVITIGGYAAWSNYSDRRLKENIVYKDGPGLAFISKLKPVSYNYKGDHNKRRRDGLIAQDVQQVMEELDIEFSGLIIDQDPMQTLNLSYVEFVIPLINAVKELKAQNEQLASEKDDLEVRIEKLEAWMAGMAEEVDDISLK